MKIAICLSTRRRLHKHFVGRDYFVRGGKDPLPTDEQLNRETTDEVHFQFKRKREEKKRGNHADNTQTQDTDTGAGRRKKKGWQWERESMNGWMLALTQLMRVKRGLDLCFGQMRTGGIPRHVTLLVVPLPASIHSCTHPNIQPASNI